MRRGPIIVIIFVLLAAGVVGASQFLRSQPPLEVAVAVNPLAESWVRAAVDAYNATEPVVNATRRVVYHVTAIDDLTVWSDEVSRQWTETDHPAAWIPATSVSLDYATRLPFEVVQPSLAQTVLTWGGFADRVAALTDGGSHPLDWDDVARAVDAQRWANIPGASASWGNVTLAFSRPNRSLSGLTVLFSGAGAFGKQTALDGSTLQSTDYRNWMAPILSSVPNYNTLGASVAGTLASRGASVGEIALLPESEWLNQLHGNLVASANPIQLSYPTYEFSYDFPLARWQGMTADENAAVAALGSYLLGTQPEAYGLRPASGSPASTASLFAQAVDYGAQIAPDLSQAVQAPPRAETQRLLSWVGTALP